MERSSIWLFSRLTAVLGALCAAGCAHDPADVPRPGPQELPVCFEMTVPGFHTPVTRSIDGDGGEAAVRSVDLLIFDDSSPARLIRSLKTDDLTQGGAGPDYKVEYRLDLPADPDAGLIVVVANASDEVDAALAEHPPGAEKQAVLEALKFAVAPGGDGTYKWNVSTPGFAPIPMYGEAAVSGIRPGMKVSGIRLMRMLARIDVENEVVGDIFRLERIHLVNYRTGGFIAPAWDPATGTLLREGDPGHPYSTNGDPRIPDDAGKPEVDAAQEYPYDQPGNTPGARLAGTIYTCEADKGAPPADPAGRVCLVLEGSYRGAVSFYRIDFTAPGEADPGSSGARSMPLYRNHRYIVSVTAAEGPGYATFGEAVAAATVLSNLKTSLLVVDLDGINEIVFDGQYFMGVETRTVDLPWGAARNRVYRVSSDYHGGWRAEVLDPDAHTWLRLAGDAETASGTDINRSGLAVEITPLEAPVAVPDYVSGRIVFTAGRLRDTLTVRRTTIAELFARSNVVLRAGAPTFAVTREENRSMPAWSQGVFFKWGSLLAVAPSGNPYDPGLHVVFNPSSSLDPSGWGDSLAGWDRIPYAHPNFGFDGPAPSDSDADAFRDYRDGAGYDADAGIGDICRYVSGRTEWTRGRWRMPTSAEQSQLYEETRGLRVSSGDFRNITATFDGLPDGTSDPVSGLFAGGNVTVSTAADPGNRGVPPDGTLFLPVSGHRYPNGHGSVVHIGAYGYYWSATPYTTYSVDYLFLSNYGFDFYDADRSYGYPVRCIRDY